MDFTIIILATIVVLLIYVLYYYFAPTKILLTQASLKSSNPKITLTNPNNSIYTYGFLLYLVDNKISAIKNLINTPTFNIKLTSTMALQCIPTISSPPTFTIMNSVPINQWTYITISANNNVMDFYINGKLVSSNTLSSVPPSSANSVTLGTGINATIQSFTYSATYSSPSDVYNAYLGLNDTTLTNNPLTTYTVDVSLLKNGKVMDSQVIL